MHAARRRGEDRQGRNARELPLDVALIAQLHRQLRDWGRPMPTHDLWMAALVVQHDLVLCMSDRHFRQAPQLVTC